MSDNLNLLTAIIGLLAALMVFTKNKTRGKIEMENNFRALKSTFNIVGTISLIMILFFGFIILMYSMPRIFSMISGNDRSINNENITLEVNLDNNVSNNHIAFEAIKRMPFNTGKNRQLMILLERTISTENYEYIRNIINEFSLNKQKTDAINIAFNHYISEKEYHNALNIIQYYPFNNDKEKMILQLLNVMYEY